MPTCELKTLNKIILVIKDYIIYLCMGLINIRIETTHPKVSFVVNKY